MKLPTKKQETYDLLGDDNSTDLWVLRIVRFEFDQKGMLLLFIGSRVQIVLSLRIHTVGGGVVVADESSSSAGGIGHFEAAKGIGAHNRWGVGYIWHCKPFETRSYMSP